MKLRTEIIAGATTFLTMSYILAVNPSILASTGMDKGALFTGTALAAAIATLLLAFMAKLPFAQAPSMGLNAFFAYTLCVSLKFTWQQSLAIMLIEGYSLRRNYLFQCARDDSQCHPDKFTLCHISWYWYVHCLYRSEECKHYR